MEKVSVGGIQFSNVTLAETCDLIDRRILKYEENTATSLVICANIDIFNHIQKFKDLSVASLNTAFLIVPDGFSIIAGAKILGTPLKERVAGPDLMMAIISQAHRNTFRHFFLGAREGVAAKMCAKFKEQCTSVEVAGVYAPPFGDFTAEENTRIIEMVNDLSPDILWVSFGCPKQELWALQHQKLLKVPITIGVGAAFDFHSGNMRRAPILVQKLGFEWLFRLLQEPKRLSARYMRGIGVYAKVLWLQKRGII